MIHFVERVLRRATLPALIVVGVVTTIPGNWLRVQNVDPQFAMVLVQRTMHFGGSFFDNAVQDHGPLEPFVYDVASRVGGYNGAWYMISALVTAVGLALGYVAARTARFAGAAREIGIAVGAAVFVHFTISRSNYAGVLYIRNLTTVLLAAAWLVLIEERVWSSARRRRYGAVAIGFLLGLAVQSLLSTFAAGVLGLLAIAVVWLRVEMEERLPLAGLMGGSAFVTFVSAPVYYLARGDFTEFWSGWIRYGHFMAIGPGKSTVAQLTEGWHTFVRYYSHRPLAWLMILAFFVLLTALGNRIDTRTRLLYAGLLAWWIAGWVELALSQRYSAEYYVVTSVPTALMAAVLAGYGWRSLVARRVPARALVIVPLAAAIIAVLFSSTTNFDNDVRAAWRFRGFDANAAHVAKDRSGTERSVLAVLDLVSRNGDPMLVWTEDPWPYLNLHRVSATRFFYKSFLLGEIYLGRTSTAYVLPHTWQWFAQDLNQSKPVAYLRAGQSNLPPGTPFASYVAQKFDLVFPDADLPVSLRRDVANEVLGATAAKKWSAPPPTVSQTGWQVNGANARYVRGPVKSINDQLTLATSSCFRLDGHITADKRGNLGHVVFRFFDNTAKTEAVKMSFQGRAAAASNDYVDFLREPTGVQAGAHEVPFSLVVGSRSAALVLNGQVRAALLLPRSVTVTAESTSPTLTLSGLHVGPPPTGSGCNTP